MSCYHPLLGVVQGYKDSWKDTNKFDSSGNRLQRKVKSRDLKIVSYEKKQDYLDAGCEVVEIPCGKCIGCRLDYSRQWANRMLMELEYYDSAYFVTLTYQDDFLPKNKRFDQETGEVIGDSITLRKKHLSKFMKHVRKHFPDKNVKFYGCGEYGTKNGRPHMHLIIFGLHLDDLKLYKVTPQGDKLYTSEKLSRCWSNHVKGRFDDPDAIFDKVGYVVVADVTWETCAYVARYVTKKLSGPLGSFFEENNMEQPFCLMSRKEAIGKRWYEDHPGYKDYDYISIRTPDKGVKFRPPKYFDKLFERDDLDEFRKRKDEKNDILEKTRAYLESSLEKSYLDYLADREYFKKERVKSLDRSKV